MGARAVAAAKETGRFPCLPLCSGRSYRRSSGCELGCSRQPAALISGLRLTAHLQYCRCTLDRKSTRRNSSHRCISYSVVCVKKNQGGEVSSGGSQCAVLFGGVLRGQHSG